MHLFDDFLIVVLMNSIVVCCCKFVVLTRFRGKIFKNSQSCIVVESSESSWIAATCAVKVGLKLFVTSPRIITNSRRTKVTPSQILFSSF